MDEALLPKSLHGPRLLAAWAWLPFPDSSLLLAHPAHPSQPMGTGGPSATLATPGPPPRRAQPGVSPQSAPWGPQEGKWVSRQALGLLWAGLESLMAAWQDASSTFLPRLFPSR